MEAQIDLILAYQNLAMQMAEGVDEIILINPINRFGLSKAREHFSHQEEGSKVNSVSTRSTPSKNDALELNFLNLETPDKLLEVLRQQLPETLTRNAHNCFECIGQDDAEIAIIVDPPGRLADQMGNLLADVSQSLLIRSLHYINLAIDQNHGREPRARIALLPISPWRLAQDRKLLDQEAEICLKALEARMKFRQFKHVLLAGSNLAGVEKICEDGQLFGHDVTLLVPPSLMINEPLLKRKHWEILKKFHLTLDEILKI